MGAESKWHPGGGKGTVPPWLVAVVCVSMSWELCGGSSTVLRLAFLGESGQRRELCKPHPNLKKLEGGFEALPWPRGGPSPPEIQSASQLGAAPKGPNRSHQSSPTPASPSGRFKPSPSSPPPANISCGSREYQGSCWLARGSSCSEIGAWS